MAWRESRTARVRLIWFSLSISLGVAALAAVGSLSATLREAIEVQAKTLLGADLVLASRQPFSPEAEALARSVPALERARETSFSTMAVFPALTNATRLVNARALEGEFPFYGQLECQPPSALEALRRGDGVILDSSVLFQFGLKIGDPVHIGRWRTQILGSLVRVPGDTVAFSALAPRAYLSASRLTETGLLGVASLARYRMMFRWPDAAAVEQWSATHRTELPGLRLEADTVDKRKQDLGRTLQNLNRFLNLVAAVALILGSIGIASALQVHVGSKLANAAILRCLGAGIDATSAIYLAQGLALTTLGTAVGLAMGGMVQPLIPRLLEGWLPVTFEAQFQLLPAVVAALAGFSVSLAFTLLPLGVVRSVSPLSVIRADYSRGDNSDRRWRIQIGLAILAGLSLFATVQARKPWEGLATVAGLLAAFGALAGVARMLTWMVRKWTPASWPFAVRQGLASLHRPGNRTLLVLTSVGLGTFLLVTLQLTRDVLLTQLFPTDRLQQPNAILFDIQADQRVDVIATVRAEGFPVLDMAPIVTMRIASLKGRSADSLLAETNSPIPGWTLRREYRSTFRGKLVESERLIAGRFVPKASEAEGPVPITVESVIARDLGLSVGDAVTFDIQGVPMETRVAGLREVDWKQVRPNFFVVFPEGVLESAPAMTVLATRVADAAASARLQRSIVARFPNVSTIDLTLVLETLDRVVTQAGYGIRFMALFTVVTGLVVMAGAILTGRWQRVREMVLLRTLGASRRQLQQALLAEYASLGVMGALTGTLLACAAAWALARFGFRTPFTASPIILLGAVVIVTTLTVVVGLFSSRGITRQSPLEVLRSESVS